MGTASLVKSVRDLLRWYRCSWSCLQSNITIGSVSHNQRVSSKWMWFQLLVVVNGWSGESWGLRNEELPSHGLECESWTGSIPDQWIPNALPSIFHWSSCLDKTSRKNLMFCCWRRRIGKRKMLNRMTSSLAAMIPIWQNTGGRQEEGVWGWP